MAGLGNLLTAMVSPFTEDLSLDLARARQLARRLLAEGTDGLVVTGTTGESPTLTADEKTALWQAIVDEVGDEAPVLAGAGANDTQEALHLIKRAEQVGVHGLLLVTPYYNRPSQEGLYQHFRRLAEHTHLPVMLYNVPSRTSCNLLPETVVRLASDCPNVTSLKEASGILDQATEVLRAVPPSFQVFSGDDGLTLPMLAVGASGVVSVASHIVGPSMREMISAFGEGEVDTAAALHRRLHPLFRGLFAFPSPAPVKWALSWLGFGVGGVRLPLVGPSAAEATKLRALLLEQGLVIS